MWNHIILLNQIYVQFCFTTNSHFFFLNFLAKFCRFCNVFKVMDWQISILLYICYLQYQMMYRGGTESLTLWFPGGEWIYPLTPSVHGLHCSPFTQYLFYFFMKIISPDEWLNNFSRWMALSRLTLNLPELKVISLSHQ